jgi:plasmid maintenance system antidote protein VapI
MHDYTLTKCVTIVDNNKITLTFTLLIMKSFCTHPGLWGLLQSNRRLASVALKHEFAQLSISSLCLCAVGDH